MHKFRASPRGEVSLRCTPNIQLNLDKIFQMATTSGFSLHVTIFIDPLNVAEFFKHFKLVYEKVIAEPECTFFEVYQSPENPGELSWVENWYVHFLVLLPYGSGRANEAKVCVGKMVPGGL